MRLLICTQVMDKNDPILGFFCRWVEEFSKHCEQVMVICLQEGQHELPKNVHVYSLGKKANNPSSSTTMIYHSGSRSRYAFRFLQLIWRLRREYDAVFVHMNQEYILLGGVLWKLCGKKIYMWRNHYAGSWVTTIAAALCSKVFYTSRHSYTATYGNAVQMPVGIDTHVFKPDGSVRAPHSILFLGRLAPSKRPEVLMDAAAMLGGYARVSFYGPGEAQYIQSLRRRASELNAHIEFHTGVPNTETPRVYRAHDVFVNCSRSGMFDKTIFEAAASGCLVLASSDDWRALAGDRFAFKDGDANDLAQKLRAFLGMPEAERQAASEFLREIAEHTSLETLGAQLFKEIQ